MPTSISGVLYRQMSFIYFETQQKAFSSRAVPGLGMHGEIFHFEILKHFMEILQYFKTPSLNYFMKFLIFITKWFETLKKHD